MPSHQNNQKLDEHSFQSLLFAAFAIQEYNDRKLADSAKAHSAKPAELLNCVQAGPDLNLQGVAGATDEGLDAEVLEELVSLPALAIDGSDSGDSNAAMIGKKDKNAALGFIPDLDAQQEQIAAIAAGQLVQKDDLNALHGVADGDGTALQDTIIGVALHARDEVDVPDHLLREIAQQALPANQVTGAAIALNLQGKLICRATAGDPVSEIGAMINTGSGFTGLCASSGRMQLCSNTVLDSGVDAAACWKIGIRAIVVVPLSHQDQLLGVIAVVSRKPYAFGMRDLQRLQDLAKTFTANLQVSAKSANGVGIAEPNLPPDLENSESSTGRFGIRRLVALAVSAAETFTANLQVSIKSATGEEVAEPKFPPDLENSESSTGKFGIRRIVAFAVSTAEKFTANRHVSAKSANGVGVAEPKFPPDLENSESSTGKFGIRHIVAFAVSTAEKFTANLQVNAKSPNREEVAEPKDFENSENSTSKFDIRRIVAFAVSIAVIAVVLAWWQWQQGWAELEAQPPAKETVVEQPQLKVPAGAMERRIIYQVMPEYPELAREAGVQGTVLLDTVVSVEGTVTQMKFVSGPEALSQAAMNAVRWWRYEPYLVNGQAATVETTVAVDFRLVN